MALRVLRGVDEQPEDGRREALAADGAGLESSRRVRRAHLVEHRPDRRLERGHEAGRRFGAGHPFPGEGGELLGRERLATGVGRHPVQDARHVAEVEADRSGRPLEEAFEDVLKTEAGRQLVELADGPHRHEKAAEWQADLVQERAAERALKGVPT